MMLQQSELPTTRKRRSATLFYIELPSEGDSFGAHDPFGSVESVKAVSEIFTPVAGEVVGSNEDLNDTPEKVNDDPYGDALACEN